MKNIKWQLKHFPKSQHDDMVDSLRYTFLFPRLSLIKRIIIKIKRLLSRLFILNLKIYRYLINNP